MRFADASSDACAPMSRRSLRCTCHCTQCSPLNPLHLFPRSAWGISHVWFWLRVGIAVVAELQLKLETGVSFACWSHRLAMRRVWNLRPATTTTTATTRGVAAAAIRAGNRPWKSSLELRYAPQDATAARIARQGEMPLSPPHSLLLYLYPSVSTHLPLLLLLLCRTVAAAQINFIILVGCSRGSRVSLLMRDESAAAAAEAAQTASVVVGFVWAPPDSPHPACQPSLSAVSKTTTNQAIRGQPQFKCLRFVSLRFYDFSIHFFCNPLYNLLYHLL